MNKKIENLIERIKYKILSVCASNEYLWQWYEIVSNPMTYIILAVFIIYVYLNRS